MFNLVNQQYDWPDEVIDALNSNWQWMLEMTQSSDATGYWKHVEYMMRQVCVCLARYFILSSALESCVRYLVRKEACL